MQEVNLVEFIYPKMNILFLGLNAPTNSNDNGHWFSNSLSFWNLLFRSGLITERIDNPREGDKKVFGDNSINYKKLIYGVTDLNNEIVETSGKKVTVTTENVRRILDLLDTNRVDKLCLIHSKVARKFEREGLVKRGSGALDGYGKVGNYKDTPIYEVPFHNASIRNKEKYYELLIVE